MPLFPSNLKVQIYASLQIRKQLSLHSRYLQIRQQLHETRLQLCTPKEDVIEAINGSYGQNRPGIQLRQFFRRRKGKPDDAISLIDKQHLFYNHLLYLLV
jgi:hypothetical protein